MESTCHVHFHEAVIFRFSLEKLLLGKKKLKKEQFKVMHIRSKTRSKTGPRILSWRNALSQSILFPVLLDKGNEGSGNKSGPQQKKTQD